MNNNDNLLGVIATIFRWKRSILRTCAIVGVGTALIAWFLLPNYYKSTTIFYAASPDIFKPEQIFGTSSKDMDFFGESVDIDRILSIAQSNELMDFLVQKFDLYKHYDIDTSNIRAPFKVKEELMDLYTVEKNKFDAIEVSVEDVDRKLAMEMARAARDKIDAIASNLIKSSQSKLIQTYESSIIEKEKALSLVSDTLTSMRQTYGIYDLKTQSELMTKLSAEAESNLTRNKAKLAELERNPDISKDSLSFIRANIKGYEEEFRNLTSPTSTGTFNLKRFNSGKDRVDLYNEIHSLQSEAMGEDKERFAQLKAAFGAQISAVHLVEEAALPLEKSRPKRSLIVISAVLIAFVLSVLVALLLDNYRNVDWTKIMAGDNTKTID